jgi:hypothetical protein
MLSGCNGGWHSNPARFDDSLATAVVVYFIRFETRGGLQNPRMMKQSHLNGTGEWRQ